MWKSVAEPSRSQMTIWRTHIACWVRMATHTHSQYAMLIAFSTATTVACTRLSVTLRYIACIVFYYHVTVVIKFCS